MKKIFSSRTIRPGALIFGMYHHLVDLYQSCLNYAPGVENCPALGVTCFTQACCNHLDGEERAGCFAWFVFLVSCGGWAALPRGAAGLSAVCGCGIS